MKDQKIVLLENSKTIKHKNIKTQNIKHISGAISTSQIGSSEPSSLASTRGAEASSKSKFDFEKHYREKAKEIRSREIFYISASVKGIKSNGTRREVNVDVIPQSGDKPLFLKAFTVNKNLKWELFRDLPEAERSATCWETVQFAFDQSPQNTKAGKIKTRRKFRTVPNFRLGHCALITEDLHNAVKVTVILGENLYEIVCNSVNDPFFMYRGDWKSNTPEEVI